MTRQEIYQKIKDEGLAESIKKAFNKNYTNVKTKDLEKWVIAHILEDSHGFNKPETIKEDGDICSLYNGFSQLISTLVAHRAITPMEGEELMDIIFK